MFDASETAPHLLSRHQGAEDVKNDLQERLAPGGQFFQIIQDVQEGKEDAYSASVLIRGHIRRININS